MKNIAIPLIITGFITFLLLGFGFASDSARQWLELVWLASLAGLALLIFATSIAFVTGYLWLRIKREYRIYPDENGNYPVIRERGQWLNLSFIGADNPQAWTIWQATNNKSVGTPAREVFAAVRQPPSRAALPPMSNMMITAPGQSEVIDAVAEEL